MLIIMGLISLFRKDKFYAWEKTLESGVKIYIHINDKQYPIWPMNILLVIELIIIFFGLINSIVNWDSDWWTLIIGIIFLFLSFITIRGRKRRQEFRRLISYEHNWNQLPKTNTPRFDSKYVTFNKTKKGKYGTNYLEYFKAIEYDYESEKITRSNRNK